MRTVFACFALIFLTAVTAPSHIVTYPVQGSLNFSDPDLYVVVMVFDPHVSEIQNRHVIISARPNRGSIDWTGRGPSWDTLTPGRAHAYDLGKTQLLAVTAAIRGLGFADADVHSAIVDAPAFNFAPSGEEARSLKVGEIMVDLGPRSQATSAIARFTNDSGTWLRSVEARANVHIAYSVYNYFQPDCARAGTKTKAILTSSATQATATLEKGIGAKIRLIDVAPFSQERMLCPTGYAVTVDGTQDAPPKLFAFHEVYALGTARYALESTPEAPSHADPSVGEREPYGQTKPFETLGDERYLATTSAVDVHAEPSLALLLFTFNDVPRARVDERIAHLQSIQVPPADVYVAPPPTSNTVLVWVRVTPAIYERAKQIEDVMTMSGQYGPDLALFTQDCTPRSAAIRAALAKAHDRAARIAKLLHAPLGRMISMRITPDNLGNVTCGFSRNATTDQLANGVFAYERFPPNPEPIRADFPIRVDAAWSLPNSKPSAHVTSDQAFSAVADAASCSDADSAALKAALDQAVDAFGSTFSLIEEHDEFTRSEFGQSQCTHAEAHITVPKQP